MHIGVLEYETKELLIHHIKVEGYYSLQLVNQKIAALDLGYMEAKDRPSTVTSTTLDGVDHKLKQKGIE